MLTCQTDGVPESRSENSQNGSELADDDMSIFLAPSDTSVVISVDHLWTALRSDAKRYKAFYSLFVTYFHSVTITNNELIEAAAASGVGLASYESLLATIASLSALEEREDAEDAGNPDSRQLCREVYAAVASSSNGRL